MPFPFFVKIFSMLDKCFLDVVGITERDCECFDEKPEDWNRSLSGLYIDDLAIGIPLRSGEAIRGCGDGSVWDLMDHARKSGVRQFLTDFVVAINATNMKSFQGYSGVFANYKEAHNRALNNLKRYAYVKFTPKKYKGVVWQLSELCVFFDSDAPVEVYLYGSDNMNEEINSWQITPKAKKKTCVEVDELLPLEKSGRRVDYYFVYDSTDNKPRNLMFDCGCGGRSLLYDYFTAQGYSIDDMNQLGLDTGGTGNVNGIMPVGSIQCDSSGWMCREWDYWYDPYARVIARTIQFYSIVEMAKMILNSGRINFTTLTKQEHLLGKVSHLKKKIEESMIYLVANIPKDASDCIMCDHSRFQKQLISV